MLTSHGDDIYTFLKTDPRRRRSFGHKCCFYRQGKKRHKLSGMKPLKSKKRCNDAWKRSLLKRRKVLAAAVAMARAVKTLSQ